MTAHGVVLLGFAATMAFGVLFIALQLLRCLVLRLNVPVSFRR